MRPGSPAPPGTVPAGSVPLHRGSRVRLRPRPRGDVLDLALSGRTGEVAAVEEDLEGRVHIVVTLDGDPGRHLGGSAQLGHRFFFSPDELEPLVEPADRAPQPRILVAGIGNIFFGDDAFGPEVIAALAGRPHPPGVHIADFGIRGMDLAYALTDGYDAAVLVDAAPRGQCPGTLYVIEPEVRATRAVPQAHGMDPATVLASAGSLGGAPPRTLIVGCEPANCGNGPETEPEPGLSEPVRQAVAEAVRLVETVVTDLRSEARAEREERANR